MDSFKRILRRSWLLLFAAVIIVGVMAVPGTLAIIADHTSPLVNTFCPDEIVHAEGEVNVYVLKTVRNLGNKIMLPQGFQFALKNAETGETYTATTAVNGKAVFHLSFDADDAGIHRYLLTEVRGAVPGVTYSELEYEVRVNVTLEDELKVVTYLDGEKADVIQATFENLYDNTAAPETGDTAPLMGYVFALFVGIAGISLLIRKARNYAA